MGYIKNQKGIFGLISLLLGITIIAGVYFYIVYAKKDGSNVTRFESNINQAQDVQIKEDIRRLQEAIEGYKLQKGTLPESLEDLKTSGAITSVPINRNDNSPYNYEATGNSYSISTKLSDGSVYKVSQ